MSGFLGELTPYEEGIFSGEIEAGLAEIELSARKHTPEVTTDGSEAEAEDGLARLGLAFEGLTLVRRPIHEVPDPVKLVNKIIEGRNLKRPSSGAPIL